MKHPVLIRRTDYLLVDVSNSYTKFAFASTKRISAPVRVATNKLSSTLFLRFLKQRRVRQVVVSSVVPEKNSAISKTAGETGVVWLDSTLKLGVGIDYLAPKLIGAARLAIAAAPAALCGCPAIVVDFGTAVTFDIVSARRNYIGGVIAPGLEAMTNFLYQRTALLPKLSLKEPRRAIGRSTIGAMLSGAIFGYRGLVHEILARIRAEEFPRRKLHIVATGGYARLIASQLPEITAVRPHLTLEGLRIIANLNS